MAVMQAVNEVLDTHTMRLKAALDRIPSIVFSLLVFIVAFSLGVAGHNVALGGQIHRWRMSGFALILALLIPIITDFDRPLSGFIQVNQYGLTSLVEGMESALGR